ncbi:glutamate receptor 2-like [Saccoglossus kowalevskii]
MGIAVLQSYVYENNGKQDGVLHLSPSQGDISDVIVDLIKFYEWNSVAIVFDGVTYPEMELVAKTAEVGLKVVARQLKLGSETHNTEDELKYKTVLAEIRSMNIQQIIIHAHTTTIATVLRDDVSYMNLSSYIYTNTNLTLLHPSYQGGITNIEDAGDHKLDTYEVILVYDAINIVLSAIRDYTSNTGMIDHQNSNNDCFATELLVPETSNALRAYIKEVKLQGLSGYISFEKNGMRCNDSFDVIELQNEELVVVGSWTRLERLKIFSLKKPIYDFAFGDNPLRISTIVDDPFIMWRDNYENLVGNERFDGFLYDLIEELSRRMDFQYELYIVPDGKYGAQLDNGSWNGMVRELIDGSDIVSTIHNCHLFTTSAADVAMAGLTISSVREEVIDFSAPYMFLGTDVLMRKPEPSPPDPFSFLSPMSTEMWLCVCGALIVFSLLLVLINRISPYEANHLSRRDAVSKHEATNLNLVNSIWFVFSAFVQQGSQFSPYSYSARIISGTWWFFVLVFIASYTANMAAFLTVQKLDTPVDSVADLAKQTTISYGCTESTQTMSFFRDSKIEPYKTMWAAMKLAETSPLVPSNEEGVRRACTENYAFLQDSTFNAFFTNRNPIPDCDLVVIGSPFDSKGYGLAFPRGATFRDDFSLNILQLREQGFILGLKRKWWLSVALDSSGSTSSISGQNVLRLSNIAGIFYILAGGAVIGLMVALVEVIVYMRNGSKKDHDEEWDEEHRLSEGFPSAISSSDVLQRYQYTHSVTSQVYNDQFTMSYNESEREEQTPTGVSPGRLHFTNDGRIWDRPSFIF